MKKISILIILVFLFSVSFVASATNYDLKYTITDLGTNDQTIILWNGGQNPLFSVNVGTGYGSLVDALKLNTQKIYEHAQGNQLKDINSVDALVRKLIRETVSGTYYLSVLIESSNGFNVKTEGTDVSFGTEEETSALEQEILEDISGVGTTASTSTTKKTTCGTTSETSGWKCQCAMSKITKSECDNNPLCQRGKCYGADSNFYCCSDNVGQKYITERTYVSSGRSISKTFSSNEALGIFKDFITCVNDASRYDATLCFERDIQSVVPLMQSLFNLNIDKVSYGAIKETSMSPITSGEALLEEGILYYKISDLKREYELMILTKLKEDDLIYKEDPSLYTDPVEDKETEYEKEDNKLTALKDQIKYLPSMYGKCIAGGECKALSHLNIMVISLRTNLDVTTEALLEVFDWTSEKGWVADIKNEDEKIYRGSKGISGRFVEEGKLTKEETHWALLLGIQSYMQKHDENAYLQITCGDKDPFTVEIKELNNNYDSLVNLIYNHASCVPYLDTTTEFSELDDSPYYLINVDDGSSLADITLKFGGSGKWYWKKQGASQFYSCDFNGIEEGLSGFGFGISDWTKSLIGNVGLKNNYKEGLIQIIKYIKDEKEPGWFSNPSITILKEPVVEFSKEELEETDEMYVLDLIDSTLVNVKIHKHPDDCYNLKEALEFDGENIYGPGGKEANEIVGQIQEYSLIEQDCLQGKKENYNWDLFFMCWDQEESIEDINYCYRDNYDLNMEK